MKKISRAKHLLFYSLMWFSATVTAQVSNDVDLLLQPGLFAQDLEGNGNTAFIQQAGALNKLELFQQNTPGASGNFAKVLQSGDRNFASAVQAGSGNQLVLTQRGNQNFLELLNEGDGNELVSIQDGNGNRLVQQLIESDFNRFETIQIGGGNEIISIQEGVQGRNYSVRQMGDGMKVIIRQSSF